MSHPLVAGLPIPIPAYLIVPILAGVTTFVQSRMMQQPPNPVATEQEQQAQQVNQSMQVVMPLMICYFAVITPAGLGLYWFVSNCFAIIQQYFVTGWGGLFGYRDLSRVVTAQQEQPKLRSKPKPQAQSARSDGLGKQDMKSRPMGGTLRPTAGGKSRRPRR
jgi:hypothetical protein